METGSQVSLAEVAAGNAGFVIAQALLQALIARKVLAPADVAPMLQEVIEIYRQPPPAERSAVNDSVANVLEAILARHQPKR